MSFPNLDKALARQTIVIAGNSSYPLNVFGDYVYVHGITGNPYNSSAFTGITIKPDRGGGALTTIFQSQGIVFPVAFSKVEVANTNTFAIEVDLSVGFGRIQNDAPSGLSSIAVQTAFNRPANLTAYAVGDVVGLASATIISFNNLAREKGGTGVITKVQVRKETVTTLNANFRLYLFSYSGVTVAADNDPFVLSYDHTSYLIGVIDLPQFICDGAATCALCEVSGLELAFGTLFNSDDIYGCLVAQGAYVPGSAEQFIIRLWARQD